MALLVGNCHPSPKGNQPDTRSTPEPRSDATTSQGPDNEPPLRDAVPLDRSAPEGSPPKAARVVSEPKDKIAFIYEQDKLRTFALKLTKENLAKLDADPTAEEYVTGKLVFEGKEYGPVGIRYKGSLGAWLFCTAGSTQKNPTGIGGAKTCPKLSLKVSFNKYNPEGRFFGVKKLLFHAMNNDPSMMRERLGYWLFRQMKVPAPRAVHVKLLINGTMAGVFLNVEYIDGRFTRSHFADGKGNLYKEVWPSASALQPPVTTQLLLGGLRTNENDSPSVQKMLDFARAVSSQKGDARADTIRSWMDVDNTMRYIVVDRTIRSDDGPFHFYCRRGICKNHNFYIYEEEKSKRIWLLPWDLDLAFVVEGGNGFDNFLRIAHEWDDRSVACKPFAGGSGPPHMPPSCDPLWRGLGESFGAQYIAVLKEMLSGPFSPKTTAKMLGDWKTQISALVDEVYKANKKQLSPKAWQDGLLDLQQRMKTLRELANRRLK